MVETLNNLIEPCNGSTKNEGSILIYESVNLCYEFSKPVIKTKRRKDRPLNLGRGLAKLLVRSGNYISPVANNLGASGQHFNHKPKLQLLPYKQKDLEIII